MDTPELTLQLTNKDYGFYGATMATATDKIDVYRGVTTHGWGLGTGDYSIATR